MKKLLMYASLLLLSAGTARAADPPREVMVFAAASLKEVFTDLARELESKTPGLKVQLNFAGSQELRTQIEHGARADVFASADLKHMAALEKAGLLAGPSRIFTRNELVVVVPRGNPAGVRAFADLPSARRLVIGSPDVPVGGYTMQVLNKAGAKLGKGWQDKVLARIVSKELNVRQVLAKVSLGEADVGVVYRTDALTAKDKVDVVEIPADFNVVAEYPIAVVKNAPQPEAAKAFVELLLSADGQKRMLAAGFSAAR